MCRHMTICLEIRKFINNKSSSCPSSAFSENRGDANVTNNPGFGLICHYENGCFIGSCMYCGFYEVIL
jgi:hypothetical protein